MRALPPDVRIGPGGTPLPVEERISAYAHCGSWDCPTECRQFRVDAIKRTHYRRYVDLDHDHDHGAPNADSVERSWTDFEFADDSDRSCPECGGVRQLSDQERPVYNLVSGFSQDGLLKIRRGYTLDNLRAPAQNGAGVSVAPDTNSPEFKAAVAEAVAAALAASTESARPARPLDGVDEDPRVAAVLAAYQQAGGSSGKAALALEGTEFACSERTVRNIVRKAGR